MLASGFTNAPVSQVLVFGVVASSILATITDTKYYFPILVDLHLWRYGQFWRLLTWQLCYTNSTEVLFAAMTFYNLRSIERLWGSRKFVSFLLSTLPYTTLLPPILLACILRPLTFGRLSYLPAGPTPLVFALLAQYHAAIPHIYRYRVLASAPEPSAASTTASSPALTLTSKSLSYLLPAQLALSQLPGSILPAVVGWLVGYAYRREILPGAARWRIPGWGEAAASGSGSGVDAGQGERARRRTYGEMFADQFRGR
ncbi:hypothetical protein B0A49_09471 [Cryomyces minteri]|uniref:Peptidase S54 rhomboid domain-containing protein n=1 Tax=Cryomyces minteri TaxID=331657 RepID=A0A4U0WTJ2_9PEZI|nr:hypothetical protein B0A49_09471 [Cryomyces minteri]